MIYISNIITERQQDILDILIDARGFPLSTREIATKVRMDWKTANRNLEILYSMKRNIQRVSKKRLTLWFITRRHRNILENKWSDEYSIIN